LICRYGVSFSYCTITIGIDPGYSRENFYDKELICAPVEGWGTNSF
jgi:hypothetical protein